MNIDRINNEERKEHFDLSLSGSKIEMLRLCHPESKDNSSLENVFG